MIDRVLTLDMPAERIVVRIGLISDTHIPARCAALPPAPFDVLRGVDLLLHAGDVGELWVLDRLSAIAPVIAVHGNDETAEAQRELPYQQVIVAGGQRILLTHAHYPDRVEEMESRKDDAWAPKLARRASMGRRAGARVVVFGHTHIPMAIEQDGVLLVNPGAIAAPNFTSRQLLQSVAILTIRDGGVPRVTHFDLAHPDRPFVPQIDWEAGFLAAHQQFGASILAPDLVPLFPRVLTYGQEMVPNSGWAAYRRLAHRCWSGAQGVITRDDLIAAFQSDPDIPAGIKTGMIAMLKDE
jgi:putative phosphoesterase